VKNTLAYDVKLFYLCILDKVLSRNIDVNENKSNNENNTSVYQLKYKKMTFVQQFFG